MKLLQRFDRTKFDHVHSPNVPFLRVNHLHFSFQGIIALEDLNFEWKKGERIGIVGPNGAGKSTLLQVLAGILSVPKGMVQYYGGEPTSHFCIGFVPQRTTVNWNFPLTVGEMVLLGRTEKIGTMRFPKKIDWEKVHYALELVKLQEKLNHPISALSGGQQQRLFLARAIAQEAELLLLDEPFNHLDEPSKEDILSILYQIHQEGITIATALHDLSIATSHCDKVMLLNRRLFGFDHPTNVLNADLLRQTYGSHLHSIVTQQETLTIEDCCHTDEINSNE